MDEAKAAVISSSFKPFCKCLNWVFSSLWIGSWNTTGEKTSCLFCSYKEFSCIMSRESNRYRELFSFRQSLIDRASFEFCSLYRLYLCLLGAVPRTRLLPCRWFYITFSLLSYLLDIYVLKHFSKVSMHLVVYLGLQGMMLRRKNQILPYILQLPR